MDASNQRSVRKVRVFRMPKITQVGRMAKVTRGPAKATKRPATKKR